MQTPTLTYVCACCVLAQDKSEQSGVIQLFRNAVGTSMVSAAQQLLGSGLQRAQLIALAMDRHQEWSPQLLQLGEKATDEELTELTFALRNTTMTLPDTALAAYVAHAWTEAGRRLRGIASVDKKLREFLQDQRLVSKLTGASALGMRQSHIPAPAPLLAAYGNVYSTFDPPRERRQTTPRRERERDGGARPSTARDDTRERRLLATLEALTRGNPAAAQGCRCCAYLGAVPPGTAAHSRARDCPQKEAAMKRLGL